MRPQTCVRIGLASMVAFVAIAALVSARAQTQSPPQAPPIFRTGVEAVRLDVRAEDASGRLVRDLAASDFRIIEDGVPQTVSTFALVDIPIIRSSAAPEGSTRIDPDAVSNLERAEGRTFVLVMDDQTPADSLHREIAYRALAREFVERHVTPDDLVGMVTMSGRPDMARSLTTNRAGLLDAIDRFGLEYGNPMPGRGRILTLKEIAEYLDVAPGRRKAIVLFTEFAPGLSATTFRLVSQATDDLRDLIRAAAHANVGIYVVESSRVAVRSGRPSAVHRRRGGPGDAAVLLADVQSGPSGEFEGLLALHRRVCRHRHQRLQRSVRPDHRGYERVPTSWASRRRTRSRTARFVSCGWK